MQEEKIIVQTEEEYKLVDVEENELEVTKKEAVKYIEVDSSKPIVVGVSETFGSNGVSGSITQHSQLGGRFEEKQHSIKSIDRLQGYLDTLSIVKDNYAVHSGLAEFRPWYPYSADSQERVRDVGYFVSLVNDSKENLYIDICRKTKDDDITDIYGVTVTSSGFCGNQNYTYDLLDRSTINLANDYTYAKVCLIGSVKVRVFTEEEYQHIDLGDYVVPNQYGCASKSENNIGFQVVSKGTSVEGTSGNSWNYVGVALVPQNDNVSRVMGELKNTQASIEDVYIQLGTLTDKVEGVEDSTIQIGEDFKGLEDILNESVNKVDVRLKNAEEIIQEAKGLTESANKAIADVQLEYAEAVSTANAAKISVDNALLDIADLQQNVKPLAEWTDGANKGAAGFVAQANKDHTQLSSMVQAFGDNGADITAIMQKIDSNGAAIQHLVTHVDKYSLGAYSLSYGLSLDETTLLQPGHIYVPTDDVEHTETSYMYTCDVSSAIANGTPCFFTIGEQEYGFVAPKDLSNGSLLKYNSKTGKVIIGDDMVDVTIISDSDSMTELTFENEYSFYFKRGMSYIWAISDTPDVYIWKEHKAVSTNVDYAPGVEDGDLWYCWQSVLNGDNIAFCAGTLYCWDVKQELWVAVAAVNDNSESRVAGLIRQTADELTSTYTNLRGDVSVIKQDVDSISTTVSTVQGDLSTINQTAKEVMMGVFEPGGDSSSLQLLLNGMQSTSNSTKPVCVEHILTVPPTSYDGNKYSQPPVWDGEKFVFAKSTLDNTNGKYYFDSDVQTKYCEAVSDSEYKIYTLGNIAMASLKSRVSDTESELESWTRFKASNNETITSITQKSDEEGAEISSVVFGEYRQCIDINLELTEEDLANISANRYSIPPEWSKADKIFVFDDMKEADDGVYCFPINGDDTTYYKLLLNDNKDIIGYEEYKMKSSNYAAIMQEVGEDGSAIGLVAGNNEVEGSIFVSAINGYTSALIDANKIGIHGTAVFTDNLGDGSTTISGKYIRTGSIQSNNYLPPIAPSIFAQKGTKFDLDNGTINSVNFDLDVNGNVSMTGKVTATSGYIGNGVNGFAIQNNPMYTYTVGVDGLSSGDYYFNIDGKYYCFTFSKDLVENDKIILIPDAEIINIKGSYTSTLPTTIQESVANYNPLSNYTNTSFYYLSNNQLLLTGSEAVGTAGVYLAPDGIGLGNGNFYVDNKGNVTMKGSIVLDGSISWGTDNSPVLVLYAVNKLDIPELPYDSYDDDSNTTWHKEYSSSDYYATYSYDGGGSWTEAIRIQGKNGSSANIPGYIKTTYIDETEIRSPTIYSNNFSIMPIPDEITDDTINGFNLYGRFDNKDFHFLEIGYWNAISTPIIYFNSPGSAYAQWTFPQTTFTKSVVFGSGSTVDFTNAKVTGLGVVPVLE